MEKLERICETGSNVINVREGQGAQVGLPDTAHSPLASPVGRNGGRCAAQRLTPQEFEAAGDFLVHAYPTWSWCAARSKTHPSQASACRLLLDIHGLDGVALSMFNCHSCPVELLPQGVRQCLEGKVIPSAKQAVLDHPQRCVALALYTEAV